LEIKRERKSLITASGTKIKISLCMQASKRKKCSFQLNQQDKNKMKKNPSLFFSFYSPPKIRVLKFLPISMYIECKRMEDDVRM
jgi:hypothetical protein